MNNQDKEKPITIDLGAYQKLHIYHQDLGEQFTKSGDESNTAIVIITTAMDESFSNRSLTILLTEDAQRSIISALMGNLSR